MYFLLSDSRFLLSKTDKKEPVQAVTEFGHRGCNGVLVYQVFQGYPVVFEGLHLAVRIKIAHDCSF
jgi:ABC-type transport system involved in Fe-S cluster assembly fused permease/ATPase subunit